MNAMINTVKYIRCPLLWQPKPWPSASDRGPISLIQTQVSHFSNCQNNFSTKKAALHKAQTTTMAVFTILYWKAVLSVLRGYMSN